MDGGLFAKKNILVSFDCLVNTDFGTLKTIQQLYPNSKYFNMWIFNNTDNRIKYHILGNAEYNVLNLIMKDEYKKSMDSLLQELKSNHYNTILDNSEFTNVINMVFTTFNIDNISTTVWCKNVQEEQYIRTKTLQLGFNLNTIVKEVITNDDIQEYTTLFINKVIDIKDILKDIGFRLIYLYHARYNLVKSDIGFDTPKYLNNVVDTELITLMYPYIVDKSFLIDG